MMAYAKKRSKKDSADGDILEEAMDRWKEANEAESEFRRKHDECMAFDAGDQWPEELRSFRERDPTNPRPCLTINKAASHRRVVTNSIRMSRPQIRVNPVDDQADVKTAKMLNGILRNIQNNSMAEVAYDMSVHSAVVSGLGYIRVATQLVEPMSNLQEACIKPVTNTTAVHMDPYFEFPSGQDANWLLHDEMATLAALKEEFGAKKAESATHWEGIEPIGASARNPRIALTRYWRKFMGEKTRMLALYDGTRASAEQYQEQYGDVPERPQVMSEWDARDIKVRWYLLHGDGILDQGLFPSQYIPYARVVGEESIVKNRRRTRGLTQDSMDPCRMYNLLSSTIAEHGGVSPKQPLMAPMESIEGYEQDYATLNTSNKPVLPYRAYDGQGNPLPPPQRVPPVPLQVGLVDALMRTADDVKSASGQFNESMGAESNASSGRAIRARQQESQVSTFHFVDNLAQAMRYAGVVLLDIIPKIYDVPRVARILGEDGEADFAQIDPELEVAYAEDEEGKGIYNPTVGKYDVVVSTGPSYQTKRQEQAEAIGDVLQHNPQLWAVMGDKLVKAMDWPDSDEMAERLKAMLPPEIQQLEEARGEGMEAGQQQAEMIRQGLLAEIAPRVQAMEQALEEAGMESEQQVAIIAELEQKLEDKSMELMQKAREAEMEHQAKLAAAEAGVVEAREKAEADVAVAYIASTTASQQQSEPAPEQQSGSDAAMLLLLQDMRQQMQEVLQDVSQAVSSVNAKVDDLAMEREVTKQAVMQFLSTDQSDEALAVAVAQIEAIH